ncbi:MAG: GAF domain-containing protein, partial [Candidatus Rokuibacteriota bacterium]
MLERHRDLVDLLMSAEFPPALWAQAHGAAMVPFHLQGVYATPSMRRDLMLDDGHLRGRFNADASLVDALRRGHAYALVLQRLYGVDVELDYPAILTVADRDTGLDRHFRLLFDGQFVDVEVVGELPPLPEGVREHLRARLLDGGYLEKVLPPDRFVLRGMSFLKAIEVTDQEVLSALKRDLIDRESIVSEARFAGLQDRLRTLFRRPELRLSLAALDGERVLIVNSGARIEHACIFADSVHHRMQEFAGTVYDRAVKSGRPVLVDDLAGLEGRTAIEDHMVAGGIRTLVVAPLHYQGRVIGTLDLDSPRPGDLDASHLPKL